MRSRATWCENAVTVNELIYPVFVTEGQNQRQTLRRRCVERLSLT
jgi:delta-aminolevulinic acid dehydratase/porphobilinogen synthase